MRESLRISPHSDAKHGDSHRPRSRADGEIDVSIISSLVFPDQTAVHDFVNGGDHLLVTPSFFEHLQQAVDVLIGIVIALVPRCTLRITVVFLLECLSPIPHNLMQPQVNLVTNILESNRLLLTFYHRFLQSNVGQVVTQLRLNHSMTVFVVQLNQLLLLLQFQLKILVVYFHVVMRILYVEFFNFFESTIASNLRFSKERDGLMHIPQLSLHFFNCKRQIIKHLIQFDNFPASVVVVKFLKPLKFLCMEFLLLFFVELVLLVRKGLLLSDDLLVDRYFCSGLIALENLLEFVH